MPNECTQQHKVAFDITAFLIQLLKSLWYQSNNVQSLDEVHVITHNKQAAVHAK